MGSRKGKHYRNTRNQVLMAMLLSHHSSAQHSPHLNQITIQPGIKGKVNNKLSGHCSTAPPHLTQYSSFHQTHAKQKKMLQGTCPCCVLRCALLQSFLLKHITTLQTMWETFKYTERVELLCTRHLFEAISRQPLLKGHLHTPLMNTYKPRNE